MKTSLAGTASTGLPALTSSADDEALAEAGDDVGAEVDPLTVSAWLSAAVAASSALHPLMLNTTAVEARARLTPSEIDLKLKNLSRLGRWP